MRKKIAILIVFIFGFGLASLSAEETKYTNDSIARLNYVTGKTFIQRAADLGYEEAIVNTPVQEGDRVGTTDGRAEVYLGHGNFIRLDNNTKIDFMDMPKKGTDLIRVRVWAGNIYFNVNHLEKEKTIEIHTSDASFYVLDQGLYRLDVRENQETEVLVFRGLIEVAGEEGSTMVKDEQHLQLAEGRLSSRPSPFMATAEDGFDKWNNDRDSETTKTLATKYLPSELEDFESELDQYGDWMYLRPYGNVWVPSGMEAGWRPYYNGRWTWLPLSGWTWLPYEPWGWAPFHYGNWGWTTGLNWYWIPSANWGPAWVNWWWDYDYFAWAPMSYWGYPIVIIDNFYYDRWYGHDYPYNSRALTVIRKDQLKAKNISQAALNPEEVKGLGKMDLSSPRLTLRPEAGNVTAEPLGDKRYILKGDARGAEPGKEPEKTLGPNKESLKGGEKVTPRKTDKNPPPASKAPQGRKIRKKNEGLALGNYVGGESSYIGRDSSGLKPRSSFGFPPSPEISIRKFSGGNRGSFLDRFYKYITGGSSTSRSSSFRGSLSKGNTSGKSGSRSSSSKGFTSSRSGSSGTKSSGTVKKK